MQLLLILLVLLGSDARVNRQRLRFPTPQRLHEKGSSALCTPTTYWLEQPVDHFNYENSYTYKQRYLVCDQFWDQKETSPMFFYTGNEGDITMFYENTGFMFDIAPQFNALIVFAEHRYYGESVPFGPILGFTRDHIGYLSVEQVLADFAVLIGVVKDNNKTPNQPVVSFGGSYGGMLTAWFRLKYPGVVVGGIAASAPVLQFPAFVNPELYYNISSQDFANASPGCATYIRTAFQQMIQLGKTKQGLAQLSSSFSLCTPLEDADNLIEFVNAAYQYTAMVDYPYPNSFLQPVPAWPVNVMCNLIVSPSEPNFLQSIAASIGVYYNYTGNQPCFNLSESPAGGLGFEAWDYQSCTEMILAESNNGVEDMYLPPDPWTLAGLTAGCIAEFGVKPNENFIPVWQGGLTLRGGSNIVFSNGNLDPWSGGGVLTNLSDTLVAILIENGAHHLDLRSSNPADIPSVIQARLIEVQWIKTWISEYLQTTN